MSFFWEIKTPTHELFFFWFEEILLYVKNDRNYDKFFTLLVFYIMVGKIPAFPCEKRKFLNSEAFTRWVSITDKSEPSLTIMSITNNRLGVAGTVLRFGNFTKDSPV